VLCGDAEFTHHVDYALSRGILVLSDMDVQTAKLVWSRDADVGRSFKLVVPVFQNYPRVRMMKQEREEPTYSIPALHIGCCSCTRKQHWRGQQRDVCCEMSEWPWRYFIWLACLRPMTAWLMRFA